MIVNICCAGSSGSTLLTQLLDKHPLIACGEELNLFSKLALYDHFSRVKFLSFLVRKYGISSNPYSETRPVFDSLEYYGLTEHDAWHWLKKSSNIRELTSFFEKYILNLTGKAVWIEKTPRNIRVIDRFIHAFPEAKIIHLVRDPRDVILSLMKRGFTFFGAAEIWLVAVYSIQKHKNRKNVLEVRYEDLIHDKSKVLNRICDFIGVKYKSEYFNTTKYESKGLKAPVCIKSWDSAPTDTVSTKNVEKYKRSNQNFNAFYRIQITDEYAKLIGDSYPRTAIELLSLYQYQIPSGLRIDKRELIRYRSCPSETKKRRLLNFLLNDNCYIPKIKV